MALQCGENLHPQPPQAWAPGDVKDGIGFTRDQALDLAKSAAHLSARAMAVAWMRSLGECPQTAEAPIRPCKYRLDEPKYEEHVVAQPTQYNHTIWLLGLLPLLRLRLWKAQVRVDWKVTTYCLREGELPPGWAPF